jgi:chaperonin cofactor prefoldin
VATTKKDKILEWVRWGLAVLVIPLGIWGVTLETDNAVQNERISELTKHKETSEARIETLERNLDVKAEQIKRLQDDLKEARGMRAAIQANTVALGKVEVKIDAVYTSLVEITKALRAP